VQVTFIAYSGRDGHQLPKLETFQHELDAKLAQEFHKFDKGPVDERSGSDGTKFLDYGFSYQLGSATHRQRFAAFRRADGSGVVAIASGDDVAKHAKDIDAFLASASDVT
jgi:hypothetical protein